MWLSSFLFGAFNRQAKRQAGEREFADGEILIAEISATMILLNH